MCKGPETRECQEYGSNKGDERAEARGLMGTSAQVGRTLVSTLSEKEEVTITSLLPQCPLISRALSGACHTTLVDTLSWTHS